MILGIIGLLWSLVKLPIKLVLLPFRILSLLISIVVYGLLFLLIAAIIFLFIL